MARPGKSGYVMISVVAERFGIHPQTLRLYEREGLITPHRSSGNTRLYDERSLDRLETILNLTREMGVNLAGVEVILHMKEQLERLQSKLEQLGAQVQQENSDRRAGIHRTHALVRIRSGPPATVERKAKDGSDE
ncbi:MAG: helix-turn-helix transcriptional regulator [Acidobacteriota bacterium]